MQRIDVAEVLRAKNPALARWIPRPVVAWLRRTIHEREINHILSEFSSLPPFEFIRASLDYMGIRWRTEGMERIDPSGRYVFASNHPFGGLDGLILACEVERHLGDARVVVNDLLMHIDPLRPIFVPVNKHGRQNTGIVQAFQEVFAGDLPVITFPAGVCSRRVDGRVVDLIWKTSFVKQARACGRKIVPVWFAGELSRFFYRMAAWRKRSGIRANVEMLWLPDEMFRQQGSDLMLRIGEPVAPAELEGMSLREAADAVRGRVYALANGGPAAVAGRKGRF